MLYLRPDALFLSDLDLPRTAQKLDDVTIATPDWACSGGLWNDRMAYGTPAAMIHYGLRGNHLAAYVAAGWQPHAEAFLAHEMAARGIGNLRSRTVFQRMRADGHVDHRDARLGLLAAWRQRRQR